MIAHVDFRTAHKTVTDAFVDHGELNDVIASRRKQGYTQCIILQCCPNNPRTDQVTLIWTKDDPYPMYHLKAQ